MGKVKDFYGDKFLSVEENITVDFIHSHSEGYEKNSPTVSWDLTINTGVKDEKGYVDVLIIKITDAQYSSFLDAKHGETVDVEFSIIQTPKGMTEEEVKVLVSKYAIQIESALDEVENED